jgi:esterase/lipase superfamily enzyme
MTLVLALLVVTACTPRGTMTIVPPETVQGQVTQVFVGTTRVMQPSGIYGLGRSEAMGFARYDIAIPPSRKLGEIRFPPRGKVPDVTTDFLTTAQAVYPTERAFRSDLSRALRADGREAVIFVHGFNSTFTEGLYRIAQLSHDMEIPGVAVHYSWPSAAQPLGYVYDRDSMLFARSGLEDLIREVAAAGASRITLVAHSMGAALMMEALRQIAMRDGKVMPQIEGVILISPDIDVDVFRMQAREIGTLPQPFLIFGSGRDRVLRLSAWITGQNGRLGTLTDMSRVADLEVTYLDVGAFSEGGGHFTAGTSEALILLMGRIGEVEQAFGRDVSGRAGLLPGVILTVRSATQIILLPVAEITGDALR